MKLRHVTVKMEKNTNPPASEKRLKIYHVIASTAKNYWKKNGKVKFIFTALGIIVLFVYVGILQEKIMRGCYGDNESNDCSHGEKFKYELTLVLVKSFFALIFVQVLNWLKPEKREDTTPQLYYAGASAVLVLATVSSYMALRWVTFPMQVIFKSAKPLSVMLLGLFLCKRYKIQRYFFVLLIVTGVIVFKLFESKKSDGKAKKFDAMNIDDLHGYYGIGLLVFSLFADGVLGVIQDRIRDMHAPTFRQIMFQSCAWCCIILLFAVIVTGEIFIVFPFIGRHTIVLWDFCALGIADAIGNVFTFAMISSYGALPCSVITTVRKFFSVIFSIIFFSNPSTPLQWLGACLVFSGLIADAIFGKGKSKKQKEMKTKLGNVENGEVKDKTAEKDFTVTEKTNTETPDRQNIYSIC